MSIQGWTEKEFLCFMLLYAAHADEDFAPEEKQLILDRVGEEIYERIYADYTAMEVFDRIDVIASYREAYLDTEAKKAAILEEMKKVFLSDDVYLPIEQEMLKTFERIL